MKIELSLLLLFCLLNGMLIQAQEIDITGTWTIFEMIWNSGDEVNKTTEDQMKNEGMTTEYSLMPGGKFELISNMTGSGNMESAEGTWKLEGDKLTFNFNMDGNQAGITWDFEFKDGVMNLKRTSPDGSVSVVNSFKRK